MKAAGYRTAAFQANPLMLTAHGYDRGFDRYEIRGTLTLKGRPHARPLTTEHAEDSRNC